MKTESTNKSKDVEVVVKERMAKGVHCSNKTI